LDQLKDKCVSVEMPGPRKLPERQTYGGNPSIIHGLMLGTDEQKSGYKALKELKNT
jgi:hypothetical protein